MAEALDILHLKYRDGIEIIWKRPGFSAFLGHILGGYPRNGGAKG